MRAPRWRQQALRSAGSLRTALERAAQLSLELIFPPECAVCQGALESGESNRLCLPCRLQLFDATPACSTCGARRPPQAELECQHCRVLAPRFVATVRLGSYDGALRAAVLAIKHPRQPSLTVALGEALAERCAARFSTDRPDVVIPIPMHWTRQLRRGANSPAELGVPIAARLRIPLAEHLLVRSRRTMPQARLSPRKRRANVKGAFRVRPHRDLPGSHVLLIDDILTTGATLNEAAKVLLQAQVRAVSVAVVARAEGLD